MLPTTHLDQPRASSRINDNYCVTKLQARLLARSPLPSQTIDNLNVKFHVVSNVYSAPRHPQNRELSPGSAGGYCKSYKLKVCEKCFLCHSVVLCSTYNKCQKCCTKSACRGQTSKLLANLAGSGSQSKSSSVPKRGLHPSLPDPAKTKQGHPRL